MRLARQPDGSQCKPAHGRRQHEKTPALREASLPYADTECLFGVLFRESLHERGVLDDSYRDGSIPT